MSLAVQSDEIRKALKHNAKVVDLQGAASGQALVQALQWDTFHRHLLHVDLLRVDATERVHISVQIELKGDAAGSNEGGVVEQTLMHAEVEAPPASIPEVLYLDITELHLGGSLSADSITGLPDGAKLLTSGDTMVVHCVQPAGAPALDSVAAEETSPEVIGKKEEEADSGE